LNAASTAARRSHEIVCDRWMRVVLRIAAGYNLLAGACMVVFVHEGYKLLGLEKPALVMPVQLVGVLVAIFGLGYWLVACDPLTNRNVLLLGLLSKTLGPALAIYYVVVGKLTPAFILVLLVADLIYVPPFAIILRRLYRVAGEKRAVGRGK
jgi:hypothetical protein